MHTIYTEIDALNKLKEKFNLKVEYKENILNSESFFQINFHIHDKYWKLYVDDEYSYYSQQNQLICIFLCLKSLVDYRDENDYLEWCNLYGLNASKNHWRSYHMDLSLIYKEIEQLIGKINPYISSWDYEMRTGVLDALISYRD